MSQPVDYRSGFISALIMDGRPLLRLVAMCLMLSGGFAIFQSATGHFLPHDEEFLKMTAAQLCGFNQCRVVHFMFHDRVSFGGAIIAIGILYLWLTEFPMRAHESWAWWAFLVSGTTGFGSFLAYLGYGYLDTWHGMATLFLLVPYLWGMVLTSRTLEVNQGISSLLRSSEVLDWSRNSIGRILLLATSVGMMLGGTTILLVGMTQVFVPQDIVYIGLNASQLNALNPRLIPLIAHDRAGFGGGLVSTGVIMFFCVWCGRPSRSLWQAVILAGGVGFVCAIGIHPIIGYTDLSHLFPAYIGVLMFLFGVALTRPRNRDF